MTLGLSGAECAFTSARRQLVLQGIAGTTIEVQVSVDQGNIWPSKGADERS